MTIFGVDSVISIAEDTSFFYHHGKNGLVPVNGSHQRTVRLERKALFKENGAIYLTRSDWIQAGKFFGEKIGHITMLPEESVKIRSEYEFWLAEKIAADWMGMGGADGSPGKKNPRGPLRQSAKI